MLTLVAALLLAGGAAEAAAPPGAPATGAVVRGAEDLVARLAPGEAPAVVALAVLAPAEPLRSAAATALAGALSRRGWTVVPLERPPPRDREAAARDAGADLLVTVRPSLAGRSLSLVAEVVPTRPNFFLQGRPALRPAGSRLVTVAVEADLAARALAATPAARGGLALRPLAVLPEPVLALAAGPTADAGSAPRLVAVTPSAVLLLDAAGAVLASHPLPPPSPGPRVRDPGAAAVVSGFGPGRIGYAVSGRGGGELLSAAGDRLQRAGALPAVPLSAGAAGVLFGSFAPGLGVLEDSLSLSPDGATPPRSPRWLLAAAAAPGPATVAFAVLDADFTLRLLGPALGTAAPEVPGVGVAFALADLDGDGEAEVVASSALPGGSDRVRVLRPGRGGEPLFQSGPIPGSLRAAAAADLTGDGVDDVVLAATLGEGGARLWLLTADAGGGSR